MPNALLQFRDLINCVVHLEPLYQPQNDSLLGLLRNSYIENMDYNRDLLGVLEDHDRIKILDIQLNLLGCNPLNHTSLIRWRFEG